MRHFILIIGALITTYTASGQHSDIILLKSSEVVRGTITDSIPGVNVSIVAMPGSELRIIPIEEIVRIIYKKSEKQKMSGKAKAKASATDDDVVATYYQGYLRGGFIAKGKEGDSGFFKFDFINSVGVNGVFSAGIGLGVRVPMEGDGMVIPVFGDLRATFIQGNISPVVSFSAGPAFLTNSQSNGPSVFVNPAAGIRLGSAYTTHFMITIGVEQFEYFGNGDRTTAFGTTLRDVPVKKDHNAWTLSVLIGF